MIIIKGTPQRGPAATFMFVPTPPRNAVLRSGGSGRRRSPEALPAPIQQPCVERRLAFVSPDVPRTDHCRSGAAFALHLRPSPNAPTLAARARTPFAHDRCAGPVGRGCGHSPRRRRTSCPIRVPLRPPGRPRCAPSSLAPAALHSPLRAPGDPFYICMKYTRNPMKSGLYCMEKGLGGGCALH
jgi:hypothetical protein